MTEEEKMLQKLEEEESKRNKTKKITKAINKSMKKDIKFRSIRPDLQNPGLFLKNLIFFT